MAKRSLNKVEEQIETNVLKAWYDNGLLLREIRDDKLYKKKYGTFEEYADQRWGWSGRHAYRMIEASERFQAIENVTKNGSFGHKILPSNEAQVRPLTELSDAEAVHVWGQVTEQHERPTMQKVEDAVRAYKTNPTVVPEIISPDRAKLSSANAGVLYNAGDNDECYTPEYAVRALVPHLEKFKGKTIWCPFDEATSNFVKVLESEGFNVVRSHINEGQDFYTHAPLDWDVMVSNPPFTNKRGIFERAIELGKPFALIMSNTWLNDAAPKQVFRNIPLQLLMFEERMKFMNQDNSENKITFSSSYFCVDVLDQQIMFDSLKGHGYGA